MGNYLNFSGLRKADNIIKKYVDESHLVETTWANLKELRDDGNLIEGRWYRITDYECTTTQEGTSSAGHQFDVVVLATSNSTLSEEARAVKSAEEDVTTYRLLFENSEYEYAGYNFNGQNYSGSASIFKFYGTGWGSNADSVYGIFEWGRTSEEVKEEMAMFNGNYYSALICDFRFEPAEEPVIFGYIGTREVNGSTYHAWMGEVLESPEPGGDGPIMSFVYIYTEDNPEEIIAIKESIGELETSTQPVPDYFANCNLNAWKIWYCLDNDASRFAWADSTNGKGVIYRMIDEWNNDCPYDFKNILFDIPEKTYTIAMYQSYQPDYNWRWRRIRSSTDLSGKTVQIGTSKDPTGANQYAIKVVVRDAINEAYTFSREVNGALLDNSTSANKAVTENSIGSPIVTTIPINVFIGDSVVSVHIGCMSSNNIFIGDYTAVNTGQQFMDNCFMGYASQVGFKSNCASNLFNGDVTKTYFGEDCSNNVLSAGSNSNHFGNTCTNNYFMEDCRGNDFKDDCRSNDFEHHCSSNTFGSDCWGNIFRENCYHNILENASREIELDGNCSYNYFDKHSHDITISKNCNNNKFTLGCNNIKIIKSMNDNFIVEGAAYVTIDCDAMYGRVRNFHIKPGLQFTSSTVYRLRGSDASSEFLTTVAKRSDGTVVTYCEADFITNN